MANIEIFLIRHGNAVKRKPRMFYGWSDLKLSPEGERQAEVLAQRLRNIQFAGVYCSPLTRAIRTAEIVRAGNIYGDHLLIHPSDNLKEMNFGRWECKTAQEIEMEFPEAWNEWVQDWEGYVLPEGENALMMYARVQQEIQDLLDKHEGDTVMVVSHHGCIRAAIAELLDIPMEHTWKFDIQNCGIIRIVINDGYAVLKQFNA